MDRERFLPSELHFLEALDHEIELDRKVDITVRLDLWEKTNEEIEQILLMVDRLTGRAKMTETENPF
jgi:2,3-bisphosphoglycerate-independent phosphoglycerate mutase